MDKIDFKKELRQFYSSKAKPVTVEVPVMNFLMIDGKGDPNTSKEYIDAIQTLYPVAYTLKFMAKKDLAKDYSVMPLEGLWWTEDMSQFTAGDKSNWLWTAMIMQPDFITKDMFDTALQQVADKKNPRSLGRIRLESYDEGRAAQVMYIGPYAKEGPTIQQLHAFIKDSGGQLNKTNRHHHEIYLGDPRRTAPEKLKTIIRQPY